MSKTRITERTIILIREEEHSFFILHTDVLADQTAGKQTPMVLLAAKGNYQITLNSLFFSIVAWKSLTDAGRLTQMTFISILSSVIININTLLTFRVESMKRLFPERVVNHSNRLARKVVRVPKLSALRKYLDSVLGYRFN